MFLVKINFFIFKFLDDAVQKTTGLLIKFPFGEECNPTTKEKYSFTLRMVCDPNMKQGDIQLSGSIKNFSLNKCNNFIEAKTYNGKINLIKF